MPKRTDISSILIIGAGPIVIGQACEFDYSGTQACKVLKEEGYRIILVNSNPATIMTDPNLADATYIEPITPAFLRKIIEKERPDAILPTVGGQTALNCAVELSDTGVLKEFNVELIGASREAIEKSENRRLFKEAMANIGLKCPPNTIAHSLEEALEALEDIGLPAIIRPSFTLGGAGGGIAYNKEEFIEIISNGLSISPTKEVLVDKSLMGWKEYEMEVIRDKADNCIIVCSIENIDPMGVHTGDSITVAPSLTLTDKEYQRMRNASIAVLREIGVDTGGSNVQFAVNPDTGEMLVIEMNPRVSRSSALASKATGFPIAKVAAKLAVGYTLDEILNDCTKATPASFEPTIDYIVTKIPRFTFEKFSLTKPELSSSMKSVGEAMAFGRSFAESIQKAFRSLEVGLTGFNEIVDNNTTTDKIKESLKSLFPERLLLVADALRAGIEIEEIYSLTKFDRWFLYEIARIVDYEKKVRINGLPKDKQSLHALKKLGFSDARLAELAGTKAEEIANLRHQLGVTPIYKKVDTCSAEFAATTAYMYSCYEGNGIQQSECEAEVSERKKVVILGSGPNRIGQGIEFDYACVHAAYALKESGYETIMVNCNPETVSTDYDTSDRLYFEPLTAEEVIEVINQEKTKGEFIGVILQFGGQTPLKLARVLEKANIPILGTSPEAIDLAEDRERFKQLLHSLNLKQPENFTCYSEQEAKLKASSIGYPVVVRPSYVLGGRAMEVIHDPESLAEYLEANKQAFANGPILIDRFLEEAVEIDVDLVSDSKDIFIAGIMEHIEEAGIHSGDSACSIPPFSLAKHLIDKIKEYSKQLAKALKIVGLMNIQFAIKENEIYVLEANPRASRTIPFIAKSIGIPVAKIAAQVMVGKSLASFGLNDLDYTSRISNHIAVKGPVFPFARFPETDVILGPEMKSTGEVMGIDKDFYSAYAKAQIASGTNFPQNGKIFISVKDSDKSHAVALADELTKLGYEIIATHGTANLLTEHNIPVARINKVREGHPHIVDLIMEGEIKLVINTTAGKQSIKDSFSIRRTALLKKISCSTNIASAKALVQSIKRIKTGEELEVKSLQTYFNKAI
jgi:carbamoyl-phosphate synthase large subunit